MCVPYGRQESSAFAPFQERGESKSPCQNPHLDACIHCIADEIAQWASPKLTPCFTETGFHPLMITLTHRHIGTITLDAVLEET
ncbi:hypothetical protein FNS27_11695, partial [Xylella fastidiosa subsp. fastidiosa]